MKVLASIAAASLALLGAAPALAQGGAYYTATPKSAVTKSSVVTRTALWKCADGLCTAPKVSERDAVLCELVAQRVGGLSAFTVGGTAYGDDALAKCNARVK
ncbi:CC_3452 family protein [Sphingomonas sp.]|uniref:CC_3452 family protein n=1 Tax=Sphingomonas sp. TaxID=28214 RepID=UPI002DD65F88|nr:hypothetical protein [Sphingomonas sp.]